MWSKKRSAEQLVEELVLYADNVPQRLKPADFLDLAARLEAPPFQNGLQTAFFRKL
jgi:hypothetical protein